MIYSKFQEKTLKDRFDKSIRDKGGLFDVKRMKKGKDRFAPLLLNLSLGHFNKMISEISHRNQEAEDFHAKPEGVEYTYTNYIDNESFNAYAFRDGNNEFIGVNYGLPVRILQLVGHLFACSDFFPEIGKSKKERSYLDTFNKKVIDSLVRTPLPVCPQRLNLAIAISHIACNFVHFHELSHHLNGHVIYLNSKYSLSALPEFYNNMTNGDKMFYKESQAMELDADRLGSLFSFYLASQSHNSFKNFRKLFNKPVEFWYLAISILFHIFDESSINKSLDKTSTHPHPSVRKYYALNLIENNYKLKHDKNLTAFVNKVDLYLRSISKFTFTQDPYSSKVESEVKRIENNRLELFATNLYSIMKVRKDSFVSNG